MMTPFYNLILLVIVAISTASGKRSSGGSRGGSSGGSSSNDEPIVYTASFDLFEGETCAENATQYLSNSGDSGKCMSFTVGNLTLNSLVPGLVLSCGNEVEPISASICFPDCVIPENIPQNILTAAQLVGFDENACIPMELPTASDECKTSPVSETQINETLSQLRSIANDDANTEILNSVISLVEKVQELNSMSFKAQCNDANSFTSTSVLFVSLALM
eukprot:Awhi_evm1s5721